MSWPNIPDNPARVDPPDDRSPYDPYWEWYGEEHDELPPNAGEGEV